MINFKNFGPLEALVLFSAIYVLSTLIWTASTRSAVQEKANIVKSNHKTIINFLNNEINLCDQSSGNAKTTWGDFCNKDWNFGIFS